MAAQPALTSRQQRILEVIRDAVRSRGYPPSVREIGDAVGLRSPSSVHSQLATLERGGYLRRDPSRPRAIEVRSQPDAEPALTAGRHTAVPLIGEIAAGAPVVAEEHVDDVYALPTTLVGEGTLFMLRVRGESMIEAGVLPGDLVVVRQQPAVEQGEMCAVLIEDAATVKFFRRTPSGEVFLDPANPAYEPIPLQADEQSSILGRVVAVLRSL
ncbi:transcriptional repressor LexA [soil metagenome]